MLVPPNAVGVNFETSPIAVVANSGAQLLNSPLYLDRDAPSQEIVHANEDAVGAANLAYTRPGDAFIYAGRNNDLKRQILGIVRKSYADLGIALTEDWQPVPSIRAWIAAHAGERPVLPNVLEPSLLLPYANGFDQTAVLKRVASANVAAYTKHGAEITWRDNGIPTPRTHYYQPTSLSHEDIASDIRQQFAAYDHVVVNLLHGSGGYGVYRFDRELEGPTLQQHFNGSPIQVQGYVHTEASPCIIANITPERISVLTASEQRFAQFGVHSGNLWHRGHWAELTTVPDCEEVCMQALETLQKAGVAGQINIDLLIVSEETAARHGLHGRTLVREANIRPAGSSILLRLMQGTIDGVEIDRIHTAAKVKMPMSAVWDEAVLKVMQVYSERGRIRPVVCNINPTSGDGTVALAASREVSQEYLLEHEKKLRWALEHLQ